MFKTFRNEEEFEAFVLECSKATRPREVFRSTAPKSFPCLAVISYVSDNPTTDVYAKYIPHDEIQKYLTSVAPEKN